eukprot:6987399-Prymnesium_polylepis.1
MAPQSSHYHSRLASTHHRVFVVCAAPFETERFAEVTWAERATPRPRSQAQPPRPSYVLAAAQSQREHHSRTAFGIGLPGIWGPGAKCASGK